MYRSTHSLTSELEGSEWSASRPGRLTSSTKWIGVWVDPRAGLDAANKCDKRNVVFLFPLRQLMAPLNSNASGHRKDCRIFRYKRCSKTVVRLKAQNMNFQGTPPDVISVCARFIDRQRDHKFYFGS